MRLAQHELLRVTDDEAAQPLRVLVVAVLGFCVTADLFVVGLRCRSLACVCTRMHVRGRPRLILSPQWKHGGHPCLPGCVTAIAYPGHVILSVMRMLRSYLLCMQRASSSRISCRRVDK